MSRRKFGGYGVEFKKEYLKKIDDTTFEAKGVITGDIEIGIDIDQYSWREDWFIKQFFKDDDHFYDIRMVSNDCIWDESVRTERNTVVAIINARKKGGR